MTAVVAENCELKEEKERLREQCLENAKRIKDHDANFVQCDQYLRRCNLEIKGVSETESEDIAELVVKVCVVVGERISPEEI